MKKFSTLYEAAEYAATLSAGWSFATSDESYERNSLIILAKIHDEENPADEDSFYVVSLAGSIGFCEDGEDIDWLFLADSAMDEALPDTLQPALQIKFCSNCGANIVLGARFCSKCGSQLL